MLIRATSEVPRRATLAQIVDELKPAAEPYTLSQLANKLIRHPGRDSHGIGGFPQFQRLPLEIQLRIWQFALPIPQPLAVETRSAHRTQHSSIWGVGPFTMLETCRLSREIALLNFKPQMQLYVPRDEPARVICTKPNKGLESLQSIYVYTKMQHEDINFMIGFEVCSVINWMRGSSGARIIEVSKASITVCYFATWPLEEGDRLDNTLQLVARRPISKNGRRLLPRRLQGMIWLN